MQETKDNMVMAQYTVGYSYDKYAGQTSRKRRYAYRFSAAIELRTNFHLKTIFN